MVQTDNPYFKAFSKSSNANSFSSDDIAESAADCRKNNRVICKAAHVNRNDFGRCSGAVGKSNPKKAYNGNVVIDRLVEI
jgi:hypothetical protein